MKKSLKLFLVGGALTLATVITFGSVGNNPFNTFASVNERWVHYEKREATSSLDGIREYWVKCGGGYQFSKPNSANITDATYYDTSLFSSNDPRYIKYLSDDKVAYYSLATSTFNFDDASVLTGYTATPGTLGEETRVEFYKDDNSPMYSALSLTATKTISSNADVKSLQDDIVAISGTGLTGYYVLTKNLTNPNSWFNDSNGLFSGTLDGRGHTISNPGFWGKRMLGKTVDATIKDINFTNVSIFSVLAWYLSNTLIENVTFTCVEKCNQYSNVGLVCDTFDGTTTFKNVTIDYKQNYLPGMTPLAAWNACPKRDDIYQNVTIKCLASQNALNANSNNGSLRPAEINYISTKFLVNAGVSNYKIYYPTGDVVNKSAAELIQTAIKNATGKTLTLVASNASTALDTSLESIIVGVPGTVNAQLSSYPSDSSSYVIKSIGNSYLIFNEDGTSIGVAAKRFLEIMMGYDYIGAGIATNNLNGSNTIDFRIIDETNTPSFHYRKCDWSDSITCSGLDSLTAGYNTGFGDYGRFCPAPGISDATASYFQNSQQFHTSLHLIYPGTYYDSHPKWFAVNSLGKTYTDDYMNWQLCYTCRGNETEYNALVSEVATKMVSIIASKNKYTNMFFFGVADNANYCQCSKCKTMANSLNYNSNAGAVVKFLNDVSTQVNANIASTGKDKVDIIMLAYQGYQSAPVKNNAAKITANSNVKICVAPIHADYTKSLSHSDNADAQTAFNQWQLVGGLHCWLYETNFMNYLYPYNSFKATTETYQFLKEKGVELVYSQGQHNVTGSRTGFNELKKYLDSKFMVDVNSDYDTLVNKFFANYYGGSGTRMRTFFDEACAQLDYIESNSSWESALARDGWNTASIYHSVDNAQFWSFDQLTKWNNLCTTSYNAENNATVKKHILAESIFPRFALITLFGSQYSSSTLTSMKQAFVNDCNTLKIVNYKEGSTLQADYFTSW